MVDSEQTVNSPVINTETSKPLEVVKVETGQEDVSRWELSINPNLAIVTTAEKAHDKNFPQPIFNSAQFNILRTGSDGKLHVADALVLSLGGIEANVEVVMKAVGALAQVEIKPETVLKAIQDEEQAKERDARIKKYGY